MSSWTKQFWFIDFELTLQQALADAVLRIEEPVWRLLIDESVERTGLLLRPQTLSGIELVTELSRTRSRSPLKAKTWANYEGVYCYLPPLRRFPNNLPPPEFPRHVQIQTQA